MGRKNNPKRDDFRDKPTISNIQDRLCSSRGIEFCVFYNNPTCPHTCNYAIVRDNKNNPSFNLLDYYRENSRRK